MQGIYTYIPETNPVPKEYNVAAILSLLFMVPIIYIYIYIYIYKIIITETEFSLGGSSPYTSTNKTNKNKYT
jgi:hypothetical protein